MTDDAMLILVFIVITQMITMFLMVWLFFSLNYRNDDRINALRTILTSKLDITYDRFNRLQAGQDRLEIGQTQLKNRVDN